MYYINEGLCMIYRNIRQDPMAKVKYVTWAISILLNYGLCVPFYHRWVSIKYTGIQITLKASPPAAPPDHACLSMPPVKSAHRLSRFFRKLKCPSYAICKINY